MTEPNDYLWFLPDRLGWWFWVPLPIYGTVGMFYMYKLAAPMTKLGRVIRVLLSIAFLALVFSPAFNGLGTWAIHFLALGTVLMIKQLYDQCLAAGKIVKPTSATVIERMADRVSQPHNGTT